MTHTICRAALAVAVAAAICTPAAAQDFTYGKSLFQSNCAVCHGAEGAGDGPVADLFSMPPKNLRKLAVENNGAFPFSEVYQSINGMREVPGHGTSEMPIWGEIFMEEAVQKTVHPGVNAEEIVQSRILAMVYYLQSVQE